jgi:hypothetical protein
MPIETNFLFNQVRETDVIISQGLGSRDLLGDLRSFIGHNHIRSWSGPGFNMIWRPHDKSGTNNKDFFLEIDVTRDSLSFTDITGPTGIANRGLLQTDIVLGGLAYQQEVDNVTVVPKKPLHFEPGVWTFVQNTTNPLETANTVVRMGSIPHGTTINAQGIAFDTKDGKPRFTPVSIQPFAIRQADGSLTPDDGVTGIVVFDEATLPLSDALPSRTSLDDLVGITDTNFKDPSKILSDVANSQNIVATKVFQITTNVADPNFSQSPNPGAPHEGGGINNMGFLVGAAGGPNANAARMTATFWIEKILGKDGNSVFQLQYIQRVLLNFNGLSWPHVSLATMVIVDEKP